MIRLLPLIYLLLVPIQGLASDSFARAARPCIVERLERAAAACLGQIADQRLLALEGRVASLATGVQAATGPEIRAMEQAAGLTQQRWRDLTKVQCDAKAMEGPVAFQTCRLQAVLAREVEVDALNARSFAPLLPVPHPEFDVPRDVEILVPLDLPASVGGPDADVRVPLVVPVQP